MTDAKADALACRVAKAMLSREGTGPSWQLVIEEARLGYARVRMLGRADMANGHGIIHGGMIFALADTAFAYACNSRNVTAVAASATIAFLSPVRIGETLVAEAAERMREGRSGVYAVSVRTTDGRAVAEFQGVSREIGGAIVDPLEESE
jgi:acyl-CoA thioesterase